MRKSGQTNCREGKRANKKNDKKSEITKNKTTKSRRTRSGTTKGRRIKNKRNQKKNQGYGGRVKSNNTRRGSINEKISNTANSQLTNCNLT